MVVRKSSDSFGVARPGESVVALAATEGTEVEAIVLMERGTLGGGVGTLNVPVDAKGMVIRCGEAKTWATFRPNDLSVSEFCGGGGRFKVKENSVPLLSTDEADSGGGRLAAA